MRIGIDISILSWPLSGIGIFVRDMLKYWREIDEKNEYYLYSSNPIKESYIFPKKTRLRCFNVKPHLRWQIINLPRELKKDKIDIYWEPNHCIPIMPKGIKSVVTIHDIAAYVHPEYASYKTAVIQKLFLKRTCRKCNYIATISNATKNDIIDKFHIEKNKIKMIYIGDSYLDKCINWNEENWIKTKNKYGIGEKYFIFVGDIQPRKNIYVMIDAFIKYKHSVKDDMQFVLVGKCRWKYQDILDRISNSSYKDDFILTGYVTDEEKTYLYKHARALIFPSRYEGFGFPILEAMSLEIPVITSNHSSMPEIAGNAALYLTDLDSSDELCELMRQVVFMPISKKKELCELGLKRAALFNRKNTAEEYYELFNAVNSI